MLNTFLPEENLWRLCPEQEETAVMFFANVINRAVQLILGLTALKLVLDDIPQNIDLLYQNSIFYGIQEIKYPQIYKI